MNRAAFFIIYRIELKHALRRGQPTNQAMVSALINACEILGVEPCFEDISEFLRADLEPATVQ